VWRVSYLVMVHREALTSDGGASPLRYALSASIRYWNGLFPWSRHVLVTVRSLAVRSSPSGETLPPRISVAAVLPSKLMISSAVDVEGFDRL